MFTCIAESRRVTQVGKHIIGDAPKSLPLNWSLEDEINADELSYSVFAALDYDERNRPKWWQKYVETFYLYQSQPLAAHLVQIFDDNQIVIPENCDSHVDPLSGNLVITQCYDEYGNVVQPNSASSSKPSSWKSYAQPDFAFFDHVNAAGNDVGWRQFMQITTADTYKPGSYIPLWMHFKPYEPKITTQRDVVNQDEEIRHPLPWYTFRFDKLEDTLNEDERYYTAVINRDVRGSSIPTTIPYGVDSSGDELEYSTFMKEVTVPRKDNGEYVLDGNDDIILDTEIKTMSVLEVPAVSSNFIGDSDINAIYGLIPYDVVGVGKLDNKPESSFGWFMYDGAQMVEGGRNYAEYLDYSRLERRRVIDVKAKTYEDAV